MPRVHRVESASTRVPVGRAGRSHLRSVGPEETRLGRPAWVEAAMTREDPVRSPVLLSPGVQVPGTRYRIRRWLGEGAMGVVYEAEHLDLGRRVALKVLRRELCRDATMTRLFRDEARIVSRLGAENIVEVFDFNELPDGRLMFTMELLDGQMLDAELEAHGPGEPVSPARVVGILRQVCKGLEVAHGAAVVHRDIKPANIALVKRDDRVDHVKLLDFGIASVAMVADREEDGIGTPYYLAPELIAGDAYDHRVDIYAVGCTAYEMLVGRPPFFAETVGQVLEAHLHARPIAPHSIDAEVPVALSAVVMRCLAKAPEDRYANVAELEAALVEAQIEAVIHTAWDDLPLPPVDPDRRAQLLARLPDPVSTWHEQRHRWVWLGAGLIVAVVLGLTLALGMLQGRAEARAEAADQVQELALAAQAAAAKSLFVYPAPDAPTEPTAYVRVLELEDRIADFGDAARAQAKTLRSEFAATLVRLGDEFWAREGGKPFALDYYAAALVFEPDNERAHARIGMTPGQLAMFEEKAGLLAFSRDELLAAEALIRLADSDPMRRDETLETVRKRQRELLALRHGAFESTEATPDTQEDDEKDEPDAEPEKPRAAKARTSSDLSRDPALAAVLVGRGQTALSSGRYQDAQRLFERALGSDPGHAAAAIGLAQVHFQKGHYVKAARYASDGVRSAPRNAEYRIVFGDACFKAFRYEDAREQYARAERLGHPAARQRLAKVAAKLSK